MKFKNRVAVVTGGAGRIGRAAAEKFCEQGVAVALADISIDKAEAVAANLREKGGNVRAYVMDVEKTESVQNAAKEILRDFGRVDILINNAGVWLPARFSEMSEELWLKMINLNLNGVFRVTKAFLPDMLKNKYGRIVNLASIAGEVGLPTYSGYSASKAGVIILTKTLAMELAKKNITVNSVSPGMIGDSPDATKLTWLERWGVGAEVANALLFLASDDSGYITGVDCPVDGGRILGPRFADVQD